MIRRDRVTQTLRFCNVEHPEAVANAIEAVLSPDDRDEAVALLIRCGIVLAEREPHTGTDPDLIIDVARYVGWIRTGAADNG